jgi:general L-amino acid transport system permease protein
LVTIRWGKDLTDLGLLWRRRRTRRIIIQIAIAVGVGLFVFYMADKARDLDDLGFDFLSGSGDFPLSTQWLTNYESNDTLLGAYGAGIFNTVRLVVIGIVLATVLGVFAGIARLSSNWLVSRLATLYVETIRNTPLIIQIVIWYTVVFLQLPRVENAIEYSGLFYLSVKGLALPSLTIDGSFGIWVILLAFGAVTAYALQWWLHRKEEREGGSKHAVLWAFLVFAVVAVVTYMLTGTPLEPDTPQVVITDANIYSVKGGIQVEPEFAAVLLGLVIYTGAFIAEIVRGGIQALPKGQTEAAAALGLSGYQRLTLIILPQALRTIIPPLTNQFLNLTKNSSLAVVIGYPEIIFVGNTMINKIGHAAPVYLMIFGTYLLLSLVISVAMNTFNRSVQLAGR